MNLVETMAEFDAVLAKHIHKIKHRKISDHYLGKHIQNELLELVGHEIFQSILLRVKSNMYYAVILDCTPDSSHQEQMSLVLRFVNVTDEPQIEEHFVGFVKVTETTSAGLTLTLLDMLSHYGLSINNCRGQGYDNGANMAGKKSGLQKRILEINPYAYFMPCGNHSLNLVLCDSAKRETVFYTYFGTLQRLYALFFKEHQQWIQ